MVNFTLSFFDRVTTGTKRFVSVILNFVPIILLERGDNPEKWGGGGGGGVHGEMEGRPVFYYFTIQLHLLCVCGKSKVSFITF